MSVISYSELESSGYLALPADRLKASLGSEAIAAYPELAESFSRLVADRFMGDGGSYRLRRYDRYLLSPEAPGKLSLVGDHSILQSLEDNPLNGGVKRTFEPLEQSVRDNVLMRALIDHDIEIVSRVEPSFLEKPVFVGVHQVRIVALPEVEGKPSPEGIHRDAERFTFQHMWARNAVDGGEFRVYDEDKTERFAWLQTEPLDSILFQGTTWHGATPIRCQPGSEKGWRDIFLIDFDPAD